MFGFILFASGCSFAPHYAKPTIQTPAAFKELTPEQGQETDGWKTAEPKDDAIRGKWWEMFGDTNLNALEDQVDVSNQTVAVARKFSLGARGREADALGIFPDGERDPSVTRSRQSALTHGQTFLRPTRAVAVLTEFAAAGCFVGTGFLGQHSQHLSGEQTRSAGHARRSGKHAADNPIRTGGGLFHVRSLDAQKQLFGFHGSRLSELASVDAGPAQDGH
jgi:hypothetical protein